MRYFVHPIALAAFAGIMATTAAPALAQSETQADTAVIELAPLPDAIRLALTSAASVEDDVLGFYEARGFLPVLVNNTSLQDSLFAAVESSGAHGLPASSYGVSDIRYLAWVAGDEVDKAQVELRLARLLIDFARDLNTGVLEPHKVYNGNFIRPKKLEAATILHRAASAPSLLSYLDSLVPQTDEYAALQFEKQRLEAIIANGDYGASIPANRLMRPGYNGERTILVRNRLRALGYGAIGESPIYDAELVALVEQFQTDQRLKPDGVLGPATIGALNASATDRLEQVVINMERQRWINQEMGARHIRVNLADYTMMVVDNGVPTFRSKVVVGKTRYDLQTPEFVDQMTHMVINPYWHVPKSIARKEYLPMLQQDPMALARRGLLLLNQNGQVLNTEGADFSGYSQSNFPFYIKQPPGGGNALGRVKFMFPNKHNIYLHDTPAKRLFGRERRAYSHGCVRVEKPFDLAYHLLSRQTDAPEATFQAYLKKGRERQVNLEVPIPIYLTYNTAFVGDDGEIVYRTDVYGRDKAMLKALKEVGVLTDLLEG